MRQRMVASLFVVAYLGLSPGAHRAVTADPTPTPMVSFVMNSPILTQVSATEWQANVLVTSTPSCLPGKLTYELVTIPAGPPIDRTSPSPVPVPSTATPDYACSKTTGGQAYDVTVQFDLTKPFTTVPISATLVIDDPDGSVAPAAIPLTVHRLVTKWSYLWLPIICGAALAALFTVLVWFIPGFRAFSRVEPPIGRLSFRRFWTEPLYATAAWTFKDSWATNISTAGTIIAGVLTAAGTVSTLLPGVQLDRYAILIALCGAVIVAAPLIFGVANSLANGTGLTVVPDDAIITTPTGDDLDLTIRVPSGASIAFPGGAEVGGHPQNGLSPSTTVSVPMNSLITVRGESIALSTISAAVIVLSGGSAVTVSSDLTVTPGPGGGRVAPIPAETSIVVPTAGAAITVTGVADIKLPDDTTITAPGIKPSTHGNPKRLKIPAGTNVVAADMRSVIPAGIVTMFGIGAELGILGVLAFYFSAESLQARAIAVAVVAVMAVATLWYATATTRVLAAAPAGSALTADEASFTL